MTQDSLKRLVVSIVGVAGVLASIFWKHDIDPVLQEKAAELIAFIVGIFVFQSGAHAAVKTHSAGKLAAQKEWTNGAAHRVSTLPEAVDTLNEAAK